MRDFFAEQGRTRVFAEAYREVRRPATWRDRHAETRGELRSAEKGPFLDGNSLTITARTQDFNTLKEDRANAKGREARGEGFDVSSLRV